MSPNPQGHLNGAIALVCSPFCRLECIGVFGGGKSCMCVCVGGRLFLYHLFISFKFIPGDQIAQLALKMSDLM